MEKKTSIVDLIDATEKELLKLGYQPIPVKIYQRIWKRFRNFSAEHGEMAFSEKFGAVFLKETYGWPDESGNNTTYMRNAARAIRVLGDFKQHGVILRGKRIFYRGWEEHFGETLNAYKQHGAAVGLSTGSVFRIEQVLQKFFEYLQMRGIHSCEVLDCKIIDGFVKTLAGYVPNTLNVSMFALRAFFDFLFETGVTGENLREYVPCVRHVRRRSIPSIWSKEEAKRIVDAVDTASPIGKRDMAILLMISRLGMRQSDVVNLRFDNINWPACTLAFVQVKTKRPLTLPLPDDVGNAVIEYMKHGRPPVESPYVFVKHIPPFDPLKSVFLILDKHLRHAGIDMRPGNHKGAHTLRHSLASRLLDNDVPVETIAAILGHADTNQTYDYLKVGFKALAECALDPEEVMKNA